MRLQQFFIFGLSLVLLNACLFDKNKAGQKNPAMEALHGDVTVQEVLGRQYDSNGQLVEVKQSAVLGSFELKGRAGNSIAMKMHAAMEKAQLDDPRVDPCDFDNSRAEVESAKPVLVSVGKLGFAYPGSQTFGYLDQYDDRSYGKLIENDPKPGDYPIKAEGQGDIPSFVSAMTMPERLESASFNSQTFLNAITIKKSDGLTVEWPASQQPSNNDIVLINMIAMQGNNRLLLICGVKENSVPQSNYIKKWVISSESLKGFASTNTKGSALLARSNQFRAAPNVPNVIVFGNRIWRTPMTIQD
jgi:hypothetical protein